MLFTGEDQAQGHPRRQLQIALRLGRFEEDDYRVRRDCSQFLAATCVTALFDRRGKHAGFSVTVRNITENRQVPHSLQHSEARYLKLVELLPQPLFLNTGNRISFCNSHFIRLVGASSVEEVLGHAPCEFFHPRYHELIRRRIDTIQELGEAVPTVEEEIIRQDGTSVPVEVTAAPVIQGGQDSILVVLHDLTHRQHYEDALRDACEFNRQVINGVREGIAVFDLSLRFTVFNPVLVELTGRREQEALGRTVEDIFPVPQLGDMLARLKRALGGELLYSGDQFLPLPTTERGHWISSRLSPLRSAEGQITGVIVAIRDITERKLAEIKLQAERNLLQTMVDHIPSFIYVKDTESRYLLSNRANLQLMGCRTLEETLGKTVYDFFPHDQAEAFTADDREVIRSGQTILSREEPILGQDGSQHWLITTKVPLRDHEGRTFGLVGISRDITDRKRIEEEVRTLNASLEQRVAERTAELDARNRELEAFSYSVSHDLKAPLRGNDGYSRLLQEQYREALGDEGRFFIDNTRSAAGQMQQLIDDLLAYSRVERRTQAIGPLRLQTVLKVVLNELTHDLAPVTLRLDIDEQNVLADREGLAIILRNLIDNAIKFSRQHIQPEIDIRSFIERERYVLTVKDNGTGFDMKYHDRIFQTFQRLHRSEEYAGTGIGLAIAQKAAERMNGIIRAESSPNEGAMFILDLPLPPDAGGALNR